MDCYEIGGSQEMVEMVAKTLMTANQTNQFCE